MSNNSLMIAAQAALAILLAIGAVTDLKSRTIPNWLTAAAALLAPLSWIAAGYSLWPDIATQVAIGAGFFALFAGFFALGQMGGGDVKLIGALGLWFALLPFVRLLLIMSIIGGVLTLGYWIWHKLRKSGAQVEVPYGVAITLAGLWALSEPYLNQFG
jgi:prepilin peptidase CpaA